MKWLLLLALILSTATVSASNYFYQEQANVATPEGGLNTGGYSAVINGTSPNDNGFLYVNYTIPTGITGVGSLWQTQFGNNVNTPYFLNNTLPNSCFWGSTLQLRFYTRANSTEGRSYGSCLNSTSNWELVTPMSYCFSGSSSTGANDGVVTQWNNALYDSFGTVYAAYDFFSPANNFSTQQVFGNVCGVSFGQDRGAFVGEEGVYWFYENNISVNLFDESTATPILNASITVYGTNYSTTINTTTGNATFTGVLQGQQTIVVTSSGYTTRTYYLSTGYTSLNYELNAYLLGNSSGTYIRFTVLSESYNTLPGAIVNAQRKSLDGTTYYEVQDCVADSNGECLLYLETFDATYRFVTEYGGITRTGLDTVLSRDTYTIIMNIQESELNPVLNFPGVSSGIEYAPPNTFTYTVLDPSGNTVNGSLRLYWRYGGNLILANTSVGSGSSFTAAATVSDMSLGEEVVAEGYILYNGELILTDITSVKTNPQGSALAGGTLLLFLGLAFTIVFVFVFDPVAPIAIFGVMLLVGYFTGLINFGIGAIVSVMIVIAIGIYRMRSV